MTEERRDAERDERLGMDRPIDRREFIGGTLVGAGAITASGWLTGRADAVVPSAAAGAPAASAGARAAYPPARTGLRGSTPAIASAMHALRDGAAWDASGPPAQLPEHYDLVVVGGGISGLAAAWFYRRKHGDDTRILILDPHDDFGGHARRNEFTTSTGRRIIGHGGSQSLDGPGSFSKVVRDTLDDVGVKVERFHRYFDQELFAKLGTGVYFDEDAWGRGHFAKRAKRTKKTLKRAPMAAAAKRDLANLIEAPRDYMPGKSDAEKKAALLDLTYLEFLTQYAKVHPDVVKYLFNVSSGWWSTGIDLFGSLEAWIAGYPGFEGMKLEWTAEPPYGVAQTNQSYWKYWLGDDVEPYIFHFPDGNHGIARAFVRQLIPDVLQGHGMASLTTSKARYGKLDDPGHRVRLRLDSTVVHVEHDGAPDTAQQVRVAYSRGGKLEQVTGGAVIFACWHASVPYIATDLPAEQKDALGKSFKLTNVYGTVLLRTRKAFERAGVQTVEMPGSKHWHGFYLDFPVSIGSYKYPSDLRKPGLVNFWMDPAANEPAATPRAAAAAARGRMWGTTFRDYERWIRQAMDGALGHAGFKARRDIEAITVNRWPHGYAYEYLRPNDAFWPDGPTPTDIGARPFGRYAFANSDRAPGAWCHVAIEQASRAVDELP